ncbi:MAG: signal peptidase I, partial [Ilumatobacteraceae bacterium]
VMSGSMAPAYAVDAELALAPVSPADVRVGDVIAFQPEADRPMIAHRVVAIKNDAGNLTFVTKGDANEDADRDAVAASSVRGRVVFGVPHLGLFVRTIHDPIGFAALLVVPGLLLIGQEILTIRRDRRAKKATPTPWPDPVPGDAVDGPEVFDFWTTVATEDRYRQALEDEVRI